MVKQTPSIDGNARSWNSRMDDELIKGTQSKTISEFLQCNISGYDGKGFFLPITMFRYNTDGRRKNALRKLKALFLI